MRSRHIAAVFLAMLAAWQLAEGVYIPVKAFVAQILLRDAWGEASSTHAPVRPWPWADTWPVARLRVPDHDIDLIVLSGVSGSTLAFAPGHMFGSALPGQSGHVVLSAHRDTHFRFLGDLSIGEELILELPGGRQLAYQVTDISVVDSRTSRLRLDQGQDHMSLVTCYPFDSVDAGGPLRFVVTTRRLTSQSSA